MKKTGIILFALVLSLSAHALLPLSLGVKYGYTSSTMSLDNYNSENYNFSDFKSDTKSGYNLGAMARLKFGKLFLQPEFYYAMKKAGTSFKPTVKVEGGSLTPGATYKKNIELQNLEIPILLGYQLLDLKLASLNVMTGPMAAYNMGNKVTFTTEEGQKPSASEFIPAGDTFSSFGSAFSEAQWNWQFGVGIDVLMLSFDVRYEVGLSDFSKMDFTEKSNFLTFSLAWRIFG